MVTLFNGMSTFVGYLMSFSVIPRMPLVKVILLCRGMKFHHQMQFRVIWHIKHCRLFEAKFCLYIYIKYMIWFGWVLWHIKHCSLFDAKSCLYIYIRYNDFGLVGFYDISSIVGYFMQNSVYTYIFNIRFDLVGFYGISSIVVYLMQNPVYTYILNIMILVWLGFMTYQAL